MVGKEYLEVLNISNIYFTDLGGISSLLRIVNINNTKATVISGNELPNIGKFIIELKSNTDVNNHIVILVNVIKDFTENNTYTLFYDDPLPPFFELQLNKLNEIVYTSENRKDLRYDVGLKNWQNFGLSKPDVYFMEGNVPVKCIINNASIHGVLLTGSRSHIKIGDKVTFGCTFTDSCLKQSAIVINSDYAASTYFRYSLRFLEPLSLIWCNHILNYGDYLENLLSLD